MRSFALEIVTPDRVFYTGPAQSLTVDTPLGKMGVLYQHEPVVAALAPSEIKVIIEDKERRAVCTGGFLEVLGEKVYIFAQSIEWLEDIDAQRAQEALARAKRHLEAAQRENTNTKYSAMYGRLSVRRQGCAPLRGVPRQGSGKKSRRAGIYPAAAAARKESAGERRAGGKAGGSPFGAGACGILLCAGRPYGGAGKHQARAGGSSGAQAAPGRAGGGIP